MQLAYQHPELSIGSCSSAAAGSAVRSAGCCGPLAARRRVRRCRSLFPKPLADRGDRRGPVPRSSQHPRAAGWPSCGAATARWPVPTNREAFVRTMRGVIDVGGQTVNATDRLYLAAPCPTLIVWGDRDGIIPVRHASRRPRGDPRQPARDPPRASATSPMSRRPTASSRCSRLPRHHRAGEHVRPVTPRDPQLPPLGRLAHRAGRRPVTPHRFGRGVGSDRPSLRRRPAREVQSGRRRPCSELGLVRRRSRRQGGAEDLVEIVRRVGQGRARGDTVSDETRQQQRRRFETPVRCATRRRGVGALSTSRTNRGSGSSTRSPA